MVSLLQISRLLHTWYFIWLSKHLASSRLACKVCKGANTEVHSRFTEQQSTREQSRDCVCVCVLKTEKEKDRASFFPCSRQCCSRGTCGLQHVSSQKRDWNWLETCTHTQASGHPHLNHPGPRAASLFYEMSSWGRWLDVKTKHHQLYTEASYLPSCFLFYHSWQVIAQTVLYTTGTKSN